jgi:hypothetical protein
MCVADINIDVGHTHFARDLGFVRVVVAVLKSSLVEDD